MTRAMTTEAIERQRQNVADLDIVVNDARAELERAVERLQASVRERDRAAVHLQQLIELTAPTGSEAA